MPPSLPALPPSSPPWSLPIPLPMMTQTQNQGMISGVSGPQGPQPSYREGAAQAQQGPWPMPQYDSPPSWLPPRQPQPQQQQYSSPTFYPPPPPRPIQSSTATSKPPSSGQNPTTAKKRKQSLGGQDDSDAAGATTAGPSKEKEKEKRIKTGRACDACRTKKIRCDILVAPPSPGSAATATAPEPICAHCKQYDLECTFFLPITETRFKKKRQLEEQASATASSAPRSSGPLASRVNSLHSDESPGRGPMTVESNGSTSASGPHSDLQRQDSFQGRVEGPTSISFLLHSTASLPSTATETYDLKHHNSWEVTADGNGVIRVNAPPREDVVNGVSTPPGAPGGASGATYDPTKEHATLNKPVLSAQLVSMLVNSYFEHMSPMFPIVSRQDFTRTPNPSPFLLYAICGIAATRRNVPREVFSAVRGMINGIIRSNDVLSDPKIENVQALLIIAQVGDLHAQPVASTASAALSRTAAAIRMAQDLGLHRETTNRAQTAEDLFYLELKRRIWATCVIMDRWYGAALGIPLLVDLLDCDVLLPAPYEILPDQDPSTWAVPSNRVHSQIGEMLRLSILVGRVLKTIYSPTGLKHTTDAELETLLADITAWKDNLPEELVFKGVNSSHGAGVLHMAHAALQFLFWRVFMRISYNCPSHLKFSLDISRWSQLFQWSKEAIQWLDQNDDALDTLFIFAYTSTNCALIQYHTWARRRDPEALEMLRVVKDVVSRWETAVQPDQMSIRRKTCETMTLLHAAALKTTDEENPLALNPTPGVSSRHKRAVFKDLVFEKDATKPGGGIFVAKDAATRQEVGADIPQHIIMTRAEYADRSMAQQGQPGTLGPAPAVFPTQYDQLLQSVHGGAGNLVNVNPQIDLQEGGYEVGPNPASTVSMMGPHMSSVPFDQSIYFEQGLLEGLPMASFDWDSWGQYFGRIMPSDGAQPPPQGYSFQA